jgi:hypothetical protein
MTWTNEMESGKYEWEWYDDTLETNPNSASFSPE